MTPPCRITPFSHRSQSFLRVISDTTQGPKGIGARTYLDPDIAALITGGVREPGEQNRRWDGGER